MIFAPGNKNECPLLTSAFTILKYFTRSLGIDITGNTLSLDGVYDSKANRKMIQNAKLIPNIPENKRNRKNNKQGRKRIYSEVVFLERFFTIERLFAWEDKFKRLLLRFERISTHHYSLKFLAFALINLRHFC